MITFSCLTARNWCAAKFQSAALSYGTLTFTTGGKHLYYGEIAAGGHGYHIVMDGKPGPDSHTPPKVVTSPDGVPLCLRRHATRRHRHAVGGGGWQAN